MKLTIDKKVGLFISILIFALGAVLGFYFIRSQTELMRLELNERASVLIDNLAINLEYPVLVRDQEAITRLAKGVMAQKDIVFCRIEEKDGSVLYQEGQREKETVRGYSAPIVTKRVEGAEELILDVPREKTEEIGRFALAVSLSGLNREISDITRTIIAVVFVALALASLGTYLLLERLIGIPVEHLVGATERIATGDLTYEVPVKTNDEFGALGNSFNRMTASLRAAQEELVRREKLAILGQLAGSVGNELRNPLGVMNNAVFFLKNRLPDDGETVREYLDIIKSEIDTSQRILTDFIDFFRGRTPHAKPVPVRELIGPLIEESAVPENIAVSFDLQETLPLLRVDPVQMRQAFRNLIGNAVQAMPRGGALRIAARRVSSGVGAGLVPAHDPKGQPQGLPLRDFIEISVEDTGEGIAPENMEKLFQPLFTTRSRGIGLGLPICQNLVEANGGRIGVESEAGKGTIFAVILPTEGGGDGN